MCRIQAPSNHLPHVRLLVLTSTTHHLTRRPADALVEGMCTRSGTDEAGHTQARLHFAPKQPGGGQPIIAATGLVMVQDTGLTEDLLVRKIGRWGVILTYLGAYDDCSS